MHYRKTINTIIIGILLSLAIVGLYAEDVTIQRERTYLREGAGSYFPVLTEIPVKIRVSIISMEDSWLKVKYNKYEGFISETATKTQAKRNDIFAKMGSSKAEVNVGRHGMSAGVKGFGERFTKAFKGNPSFVTAAEKYELNPKEYDKFRKDTYKKTNLNKIRKSYPLPKREKPDYFTAAQEGFGLGTASAIANLGLFKNSIMQEYINSLGHLLVDGSDVRDVNFKFFVLDIPEANAYACPGGYIFITRGMLKAIDNEAELVCILAHEIAHVSRFHGLKELDKRKNQIAAEDAFDELDEDTYDAYDEETKQAEAELEDEAFSMYETLFQGRLDAYEKEADTIGMLFAVRAGYNPSAMSSILIRLSTSGYKSNNQHYRKDIMQMRLNWVDEELFKKKYPSDLLINQERWQKLSVNL